MISNIVDMRGRRKKVVGVAFVATLVLGLAISMVFLELGVSMRWSGGDGATVAITGEVMENIGGDETQNRAYAVVFANVNDALVLERARSLWNSLEAFKDPGQAVFAITPRFIGVRLEEPLRKIGYKVLPSDSPGPAWKTSGRFVQQALAAIGKDAGGGGFRRRWGLLTLEAFSLTDYKEVVVLDHKMAIFAADDLNWGTLTMPPLLPTADTDWKVAFAPGDASFLDSGMGFKKLPEAIQVLFSGQHGALMVVRPSMETYVALADGLCEGDTIIEGAYPDLLNEKTIFRNVMLERRASSLPLLHLALASSADTGSNPGKLPLGVCTDGIDKNDSTPTAEAKGKTNYAASATQPVVWCPLLVANLGGGDVDGNPGAGDGNEPSPGRGLLDVLPGSERQSMPEIKDHDARDLRFERSDVEFGRRQNDGVPGLGGSKGVRGHKRGSVETRHFKSYRRKGKGKQEGGEVEGGSEFMGDRVLKGEGEEGVGGGNLRASLEEGGEGKGTDEDESLVRVGGVREKWGEKKGLQAGEEAGVVEGRGEGVGLREENNTRGEGGAQERAEKKGNRYEDNDNRLEKKEKRSKKDDGRPVEKEKTSRKGEQESKNNKNWPRGVENQSDERENPSNLDKGEGKEEGEQEKGEQEEGEHENEKGWSADEKVFYEAKVKLAWIPEDPCSCVDAPGGLGAACRGWLRARAARPSSPEGSTGASSDSLQSAACKDGIFLSPEAVPDMKLPAALREVAIAAATAGASFLTPAGSPRDPRDTTDWDGVVSPPPPLWQKAKPSERAVVSSADLGGFQHFWLANEEKKFLMVAIPKVACTQMHALFLRMIGADNWHTQVLTEIHFHSDQRKFTMKTMAGMTPEKATDILNDPTWTKGVFLRDPAERLLSCFLDKIVHRKSYSVDIFNSKDVLSFEMFVKLLSKNAQRKFRHQYPTGQLGLSKISNPHWRPQLYFALDKFLPYFDFIGDFSHVEAHSEALLRYAGLWDDFGASGWGPQGENAFFGRSTVSAHATSSHSSKSLYYTPELLASVRKSYGPTDYHMLSSLGWWNETAAF